MAAALSLSVSIMTGVTWSAPQGQVALAPPGQSRRPLPFLSSVISPSVHLHCPCLPVKPHRPPLILSIHMTPPQAPCPSSTVLEGSTPHIPISTEKWFPKQTRTMLHPVLTLLLGVPDGKWERTIRQAWFCSSLFYLEGAGPSLSCSML